MSQGAKFQLRSISYFLSLSLLLFFAAAGSAWADENTNIRYPSNANVFNVTQPPSGCAAATPNDGADDTSAIQCIMDAARGKYVRGIVYFPNGVYNVSDTLKFKGQEPNGAPAAGLTLQGQSRTGVIIRLRNSASGYGSASTLKGVLSTTWRADNNTLDNYSNAGFVTNIQNLTVDIGQNNPGAVGIQYNAANVARVDYVDIISSDSTLRGAIGLELGHVPAPGPLYVKNLRVVGFDTGVRVRHRATQDGLSVTLEHITLDRCRLAGIHNDNITALRDIRSTNITGGPAIRNTTGLAQIVLVDGNFTGGSGGQPAINNEAGYLFARNITSSGYQTAIRNGSTNIASPVNEWRSDQNNYGEFPNNNLSLNLPVEETPEPAADDPSTWRAVTNVSGDDTDEIQEALNSGASTIYFPFIRGSASGAGAYQISRTVTVPSTVKRIYGLWAELSVIGGLRTATNRPPLFRVQGGAAPELVIEAFFARSVTSGSAPQANYLVEHDSPRTVIIKDIWTLPVVRIYRAEAGAGNLFVENACALFNTNVAEGPAPDFQFTPGQKVWARQLNPEQAEGGAPLVINDGATLWILGIKTEGNNQIVSRNGSRTELLGGAFFTVSAPTDLPAFTIDESEVSLVGALEMRLSPDRGVSTIVVRETRGGNTSDFVRSESPKRGGVAEQGYLVPLYRSGTTLAPTLPIRVDTGSGASYTDSAGQVWSADTGFSGGSTIDRSSLSISNTSDPRIYQTERYGMSGYSFSVPNGAYILNLHFAETYSGITATGQRLFSIDAEGQRLITNLDVFAEAGGRDRALVKTYTVNVNDGRLDISFIANVQSPQINGIEVLTAAPSEPVNLIAIADAMVWDGNPDTNYGSVNPMLLKTSTAGFNRDIFFTFDTTDVSSVGSAILQINASLSSAGNLTTSVYPIPNTSWTESGITWGTKPPSAGTGALGSATVTSTSYGNYTIDVTNYVRAEKQAGRNVVSFALHINSQTTTNVINVRSRENGADQPQLIITP